MSPVQMCKSCKALVAVTQLEDGKHFQTTRFMRFHVHT